MAANSQMVRSYVESLIEQLTGESKAEADPDGDYPIRYGGALYYISIIEADAPIVHVFSIAVREIEDSDGLMRAINEINSQLRFCRMYFVTDRIVVAADNIGLTLDEEEFRASSMAVATATDFFGPKIVERFGGKLAFSDAKDEDYSGEPPEHVGMYV